ncbi:MAG: hypothetical protein GX963_03910 [Bacteroidales bacterium]|nr:hypothetical protein [Bacteroidales bacterium]
MSKITAAYKFSRNVENAFVNALKDFNANMMLVEVEMHSTRDSNLFEASLDIVINNDRYTFSTETSLSDLYNKYSAVDGGELPSDDVLIGIIEAVLQDSKVQGELKQIV